MPTPITTAAAHSAHAVGNRGEHAERDGER